MANSVYIDINKAFLTENILILPPPVYCSPHPTQYNTHDISVVDSGASNIYFAK